MPPTDEIHYQNKLARLGHQLALSEDLLKKHPLVQDKLKILQTVLHYFTLQAEWSSAGPLARLLLTFRTAMRAQEVDQSLAGFIGPSLDRFQKTLAQLMQVTLKPAEKNLTSLLLSFLQVVTCGVVYLTTQTLGNWKEIFPENDPGAAKKAGLLLRELGLTFLLGSHLIEHTFTSIAQGLGFNEKSQKHISDIGLFYILTLIVIVDEEDQSNNEELLETLQPFLKSTLESVEYALQGIKNQAIYEEKAMLALSHLQLVRRTLDTADSSALKQVLESSFYSLDLPYQEVKKDIRILIELCDQLNSSFKNIFYQTKQTVTTMTQSA